MCCRTDFLNLRIMDHKTSKLYLVRHGQASFGEKNYDNLSPKGIKQSISLGKRLKKENLFK